MAAYAALVSLMNNMVQICDHPSLSTSFEKNQMESFQQRLDFLLDYIQSESHNSYEGSREEAEDLERQIASAAHAAEDVIESHVVHQILCSTEEGSKLLDAMLSLQPDSYFVQNIRFFTVDDIMRECNRSTKVRSKFLEELQLKDWKMRRVIKDMDSVKEKVMKLKEDRGSRGELPYLSVNAASLTRLAARKSNMVGFDGYFAQLLDELIGDKSGRQIIPVIGMGGIGKTTLTRNAYDSLIVVRHFDVRAWVTVSQRYDVRDILLETLSCLGKSKHGMESFDNKTEHELGELLHKTLFGRRYLIVLDDMWSIEAWIRIMFFFPDNSDRSRIIVTTRIVEVANHFGSTELALSVLNYDQSWKLFCEKAFPDDLVCPPELEECGKKIVKKCQGLPLAIVVIGGLLGHSSRTRDQWENVEKSIGSVLENNGCFKLLSSSYSHLPARLKPCFLYLGIFPEDDLIRVSRLIRLWVAEGFIKPNKDQHLEEIAEGYVKDLVGRNLISVDSFKWNGKFKTCRIHDLLRDLCITLSEKEKVLCATFVLNLPQDINSQRRVVILDRPAPHYVQEIPVLPTLNSISLARSLIFKGHLRLHVEPMPMLLRVLTEGPIDLMHNIFQQVNLRFIARECVLPARSWLDTYHLPASISLLWNVQTLIIRTGVHRAYAPPEIWKMTQLRHVKFNSIRLRRPCKDGFVLRNLQTLGRLINFRFSNKACERMPNVTKLSLRYSDVSGECKVRSFDHYCLGNLVYFNKLESLSCTLNERSKQNGLLQSLKFPISLKKLSLEHCPLEWSELTTIGSLPHLEVLKLKFIRTGPSWNPVEGEFLRLKCLDIFSCLKLESWNSDSTHFPVLEDLTFDMMSSLSEIPSGIGDIQTLQRICLIDCSVSAALSGVKILEEQESLGNQELQLKVRFYEKTELQKFKECVEREGLTSINFQLET